MNRRRLLNVLKPIFGLSMLAYVAAQLELQELSRLWATGDRSLLFAGALAFFLSFGGIQALRLHVLVRRYTGGLKGSLSLFAIGAFFNNFLPSNVGGDAVRLVYLQRLRPGHWAAPLSLLLLHRLSGIALLWVCAGLYALTSWDSLMARFEAAGVTFSLGVPGWTLLAVPLLLVVAVAVLRRTSLGKRLFGKLGGLWDKCRVGLAELTMLDLVWLVLTTLAYHFGRALALQLTLRFMGYELSIFELLPVLAVVAVVMVLPVTVGGLGLLEGTIAGLLGLFGVPTAAGATAALVNRFTLVLLAAIGGVVYVAQRDTLSRAAAELRGGTDAEAQER